ncbi:MAG: SAM-dependent methyltransferase [Ferrimicrobium sp.]
MSEESVVSAGTLYVVGTPIGNLGDLSARAREVLSSVDLVVAEDTRVIRRLAYLSGFPLRSVRGYQGSQAMTHDEIVVALGSCSVAIVSDAGMPGVSDPGAGLVAAARAAGWGVTVVPGPSALTAVVALCPFELASFHFIGFLPRGERECEEAIGLALESGEATIAYEAPHRIARSLALLAAQDPGRVVFVARELTKRFEETFVALAKELPAWVAGRAKGEWVLVISGAPSLVPQVPVDRIIEVLARSTLSTKEAAQISQALGSSSAKSAYEALVRIRNDPGR